MAVCFLEDLLTDGKMWSVLTMRYNFFFLTHFLTPSSEFSLLRPGLYTMYIRFRELIRSWF